MESKKKPIWIHAEQIEVFSDSHVKQLVTLGNFIHILTMCELEKDQRVIYGFTDKGYIVCATLNLLTNKHTTKIINVLAETIVKKVLHSINLNKYKDSISLCLVHDICYITVALFLTKPPLLQLITTKKAIKTTIKASHPLSGTFSCSRRYVFVYYKNWLEIFKYGEKALLPCLEKKHVFEFKENIVMSAITPSKSVDEYLYYICKVERTEEFKDCFVLKRVNSGMLYDVKQVIISDKKVDSRIVMRIEFEARIKHYQWSHNIDKLAILLDNNKIEVITMRTVLKLFEASYSKVEISKDLVCCYSNKCLNIPLLSQVHWMDECFLLGVAKDLRVFLLDSCTNLLQINCDNKILDQLSLANIEIPYMKNKTGEAILRRKVEEANNRTVFKYTENEIDSLIISGNFPYNLVIYKLGCNLPFKQLPFNEYYLMAQNLEYGRLSAAFNILKSIYNPELFIQCFSHLYNYLMRRPKILANHKIVDLVIDIKKTVMIKMKMPYLLDYVDKYNYKLGQKLLTNDYYEEAFKIALCCELSFLLRNIENYCKWKGRVMMAETAKKEAMKMDGTINTLTQDITKISEYAHKTLMGEDMQNIINDYNILMNVRSVHELDLEEFNPWEINLREYERALRLELDGKYNEAKEIYLRNKLDIDAKRVGNLALLKAQMNQGIINFTEAK